MICVAKSLRRSVFPFPSANSHVNLVRLLQKPPQRDHEAPDKIGFLHGGYEMKRFSMVLATVAFCTMFAASASAESNLALRGIG